MKVYPIKFKPILKEKIWGGNKLQSLLGKKTNKKNVGESWEISDVEGNVSVVENGLYQGQSIKDLISKFEGEFLGEQNFKTFGHDFPLLIKFLDANKDLSVQVHPDDKMAKECHNGKGKTEMWYIMDSDENASIVLGLKDKEVNPEILHQINAENVKDVFNKELVKKGDSYFIPAGKIHAIGAGVLAAEIQQTSDITYRVYDWDRVDDNGNKRQLHTELAEKATKKFDSNGKSQYSIKPNKSNNLIECEYFTTNIIEINKLVKKDYSTLDSFVIFMCVEGGVKISTENNIEYINMGEAILLPAKTKSVALNSLGGKLLEIYVGDYLAESLQKAC